MTDEIAISVRNLSKKYHLYESPQHRLREALHPFRKKYHRDFWALKDVSFEVKKGETVGIIGKNGSGKSTLLQIICGTLTPSEGEISVNGRISALLELGAGFNPEFTGLQNIYMNGALMGFTKEQMDERYDAIASFADIGDFIDQPVKTYSSGMYVRLAFAAAINVDPDILVVDEALAVGDMFFQAKCMTKMKQMIDSGVTLLFVSHSTGSVKSLCNRGILLERGLIKTIGPASNVTDSYLRIIREEMIKENDISHELPSLEPEGVDSKNRLWTETKKDTISVRFKNNEEFRRRVAEFRYGTGEAEITAVELLDESGKLLEQVTFDQQVRIRIHVLLKNELTFGVGYNIKDEYKIELLASGTFLESGHMYKGSNGERYVIEFITRLPLRHGCYSINVLAAKNYILNTSSQVVDVAENAVVFEMQPREPVVIWGRAYIKNSLNIWIMDDEK